MQKTIGIVLVVAVVLVIAFLAGNKASAPVVPGMETGTVEEGMPLDSGSSPETSSQPTGTAPASSANSIKATVEVKTDAAANNTQPAVVQMTAQATIKGYAFNPGTLTVKKGTKVTWTNQDVAKHTVSFDSMAVESPFLGSGETFSYTFDKAGTYPYHCAPHPYMKGTVVVTE